MDQRGGGVSTAQARERYGEGLLGEGRRGRDSVIRVRSGRWRCSRVNREVERSRVARLRGHLEVRGQSKGMGGVCVGALACCWGAV